MTLEIIIRAMRTRTDDWICNRKDKFLTFAAADDFILKWTTPYALSEAYKECKEARTKIGCKIYENKTKYMTSSKKITDGGG